MIKEELNCKYHCEPDICGLELIGIIHDKNRPYKYAKHLDCSDERNKNCPYRAGKETTFSYETYTWE